MRIFLAFPIAAKLYGNFGSSLISTSFCKLLNRLINKLKSFFELSANKLWSLCAVRSNGFSCERSHSMLTELKGKLATVVPFFSLILPLVWDFGLRLCSARYYIREIAEITAKLQIFILSYALQFRSCAYSFPTLF